MSIQYRMSVAQPERRSREQALSDLFIPDQSFGALLRCHLDAGTGMNQKAQWSDSKFQDASRGDKNEGISKTQLRHICNGTAPVSKKSTM